jgi:hypothetical protein
MDTRALSENKLALIAYVHRLSNLFDYVIFKGPRKDLTPLRTNNSVEVRILKWVTREYVHVDRTACPWLIKRFIDSKAEFMFVPAEEISEVVKREKAIPYDAPGVELGHKRQKCSFDAFIKKYNIKDPAVLRLAEIVRAADTDRPEDLEAPGLDAVMTGISIAAEDDQEAIEKARPVYDALYTFCKLRLLREKHQTEIEQMNLKERRQFLRKKLQE